MQIDVIIYIVEFEDGVYVLLLSILMEIYNWLMFFWRIDGSVCFVKDSLYGMYIVVFIGEYIVV